PPSAAAPASISDMLITAVTFGLVVLSAVGTFASVNCPLRAAQRVLPSVPLPDDRLDPRVHRLVVCPIQCPLGARPFSSAAAGASLRCRHRQSAAGNGRRRAGAAGPDR